MVQQRRRLALRSGWPGSSGGDVWQIDQGSIARRCDGFQRDVAGSLDGPLVVLLEGDGPDETDDGVLVGEDADDVGDQVVDGARRDALDIGFLNHRGDRLLR